MRVARLDLAQPSAHEALGGLLEVKRHLVAHLSVDGATPDDGAEARAQGRHHLHEAHHVTRRLADSAPENRSQLSR